jgi:hypothetical protein
MMENSKPEERMTIEVRNSNEEDRGGHPHPDPLPNKGEGEGRRREERLKGSRVEELKGGR